MHCWVVNNVLKKTKTDSPYRFVYGKSKLALFEIEHFLKQTKAKTIVMIRPNTKKRHTYDIVIPAIWPPIPFSSGKTTSVYAHGVKI